MIDYLVTNHALDIASGRVVVYSYRPPVDHPFRMAHAKNTAHRCGILEGADVLVNMDADAFSGPGFAAYLAGQFAANSNGHVHGHGNGRIFLQAMWNRWVINPDGKKEWMAQDPDGVFGPPVPKGSNGRMAVTRDAFLLAGGYSERFETWSADDKDFNIRLRRLGHEPRLLRREFQDTILHNDKVRFREYPHAARLKNEEQFNIKVGDSDETIANFGRIGCGLVYRNFDFEHPIELGPLPTRIFGIGMHKTATTSLHKALRILGYDSSVHWPSAHWARAIWDEMMAKGRSKTLECHYAACDMPITILYKELDVVYPGSKFILTIRDEARWLDSVRGHWNPDVNPFRKQWDTDPFSHALHKLVYGRRDFDADTMIARYRKHNADVMEYFKDRPSDLLIIDVEAGHGWQELCNFLGRQVPAEPYPMANKAGG